MVDRVRIDYGANDNAASEDLDRDVFDAGLDERANPIASDWLLLDHDQRRRAWADYLDRIDDSTLQALRASEWLANHRWTSPGRANDRNTQRSNYGSLVTPLDMDVNHRQAGCCMGCCGWMGKNPKATAAIFMSVLGAAGFTAVGVWAIIDQPWRSEPNPPVEVTVVVVDNTTIRVSWKPEEGSNDAETYIATITKDGDTKATDSIEISVDDTKTEYQHDFTALAVGAYSITVVGKNDKGTSTEETKTATVSAKQSPVNTPNAPTEVTLLLQGMKSIQVTWKAPVGGDPVVNYKVELILAGAVLRSETTAGTVTLTRFQQLNPGTYNANVYALNSAGTSVKSSSNISVQISTPAMLAVPNAPTDLTVSVDGTMITANWVQPAAGDSADSYNLEAIGSNGGVTQSANEIIDTTFTFGNLVPGDYVVKVTSVNTKGAGASISSAPQNIKDPTPDQPIDYQAVVDDQVIQYWQTEFAKLAALDEPTFWAPILKIITTGGDDNATLNIPLSFADQHVLVRFLIMITPVVDATGLISGLANQINVLSAIPKAKPPVGTPEIDPVPVWTAASTLPKTDGSGDEQPRYFKLIGLERAIARYRGMV